MAKRPERMRENITRTRAGEHLRVARWRMVDMPHQRHADLLGDLKRDIERHDPRGTRGVEPYPHLDADDAMADGLRHADPVDRLHQPNLPPLADPDPMREAVAAGSAR